MNLFLKYCPVSTALGMESNMVIRVGCKKGNPHYNIKILNEKKEKINGRHARHFRRSSMYEYRNVTSSSTLWLVASFSKKHPQKDKKFK